MTHVIFTQSSPIYNLNVDEPTRLSATSAANGVAYPRYRRLERAGFGKQSAKSKNRLHLGLAVAGEVERKTIDRI